jgi:GNAT superfamily N-acetyltransferase
MKGLTEFCRPPTMPPAMEPNTEPATNDTVTISHAKDQQAVERCYPVMAQLRPHLSAEAFAEQAQRQMNEGYGLLFAEVNGTVVGVAGYRILENLAWGRFLYVDDLVTDETWRSQGIGTALLDFLAEEARENECRELHLDSGVQRFGAHRFYLANGMDITSHHFGMKL